VVEARDAAKNSTLHRLPTPTTKSKLPVRLNSECYQLNSSAHLLRNLLLLSTLECGSMLERRKIFYGGHFSTSELQWYCTCAPSEVISLHCKLLYSPLLQENNTNSCPLVLVYSGPLTCLRKNYVVDRICITKKAFL
jgi:hypothetical protein